MKIKPFYDDRTFTMTYVVFDDDSRDAVVIDPVLDYEPVGSKLWSESVDEVLAYLRGQDLRLHYILETHAHADHLSGAQMIKDSFPEAQIAIGHDITVVQGFFKDIFNLSSDFPVDGSQFDRLLNDGETINAGSLAIKTIFTPGHTPACASYLVDDALFTGDALFMPDMGTGRCDFPAGSAHDLYNSITGRIYSLPDETRIFVGHDYQPGGRELAFETTVGAQKAGNIQLRADTPEAEFIQFRTTRDKTLAAPKLLFQSIQVNIDAGSMPEGEGSDERHYLKIPVNIFRPQASTDDLQLEEV